MECFGDSSDDDDGIGVDEEIITAIKRDESCGVCSFHPNTEASLLTHVRNTLNSPSPAPTSDEGTERRRSSDVLGAIDEFCMSRHWMMHVGPEKGNILLESLRDAMERKITEHSSSPPESAVVPFVAVELGTYCGYASVLMASAFRESKADAAISLDCRLLTAEIDPTCAEIASEIIRSSGVEDLVRSFEYPSMVTTRMSRASWGIR